MGTTTRASIEVSSNSDALMPVAARRFVAAADAAIHASGRFIVALSGGPTPQSLYARLATVPYVSCVEWPRVHWFWGDERCVPPSDAASNYRIASEALVDRVPVVQASVHRIRSVDDLAEAAAAFERTLREAFGIPAGAPGRTPSALRSGPLRHGRQWPHRLALPGLECGPRARAVGDGPVRRGSIDVACDARTGPHQRCRKRDAPGRRP